MYMQQCNEVIQINLFCKENDIGCNVDYSSIKEVGL